LVSISKLYLGLAAEGDRLRFGPGAAADGRVAARGPSRPRAEQRPVVVWNCTRRCNLRCVHCYSGSLGEAARGELSTAEAAGMLEDLAAFGAPVVLFSGGEPLLRDDVVELIARAVALGLRAVLSTNGTLLSPAMAGRLAEAGLSYAGVSLDGLQPAHDRMRRARGAFDAALGGIRNCLRAGLKAGLRLTLSAGNAPDLPGIFSLMRDEGVGRACFYHLMPVGRGGSMGETALSPAETRRALDTIIDQAAALAAAGAPKEILTVDNHADGPYVYLRMVREGSPRAQEAMRLLMAGGGNASGRGIGCVSWNGDVHPDQFWRSAILGNVRRRKFSDIWLDASHPLLSRLKDKRPHLAGRCAACRFLDVCEGNSRCRAEVSGGDPWAPDPACYLTDEEIAAPSPAVAPEAARS
jgi:Fe-coproporphyrin III synthase